MSDSLYRLLFGVLLIIFLYFDWYTGIYALILMSLLEGVTNKRVPMLVNRLFRLKAADASCEQALKSIGHIPFDAERAWRLVVSFMLFVSFILFNPQFELLPESTLAALDFVSWFLPWFMGFAILGAGLSGVCPILFVIRASGFR